MSEELKPCPFCGSKPLFSTGDIDYGRAKLTCHKCKIHPGIVDYLPDDVLINIWNTRPIEDALRAENEQLRQENNATYCAYCNARYERTDDALVQVREHIAVCEFHPMRKLEADNERLRAALEYYANLYNWYMGTELGEWIGGDCGEIARKALKGSS